MDAVTTLRHELQDCADVIFRPVCAPGLPPITLVFVTGLVKEELVTTGIITPLLERGERRGNPLQYIADSVLASAAVRRVADRQALVQAVLAGETVLTLPGEATALAIETPGGEYRAVEKPQAENVIRGPIEAFGEDLDRNVAMVRRRLKTAGLKDQSLQVGSVAPARVQLLYLEGKVKTEVLAEVRQRLQAVSLETLQDSGQLLEFFASGSPRALFPPVYSTERPDRAAMYLTEGRVVILVENSPFVMIAPVFFWDFYLSPDDYYVSPLVASFFRTMRIFGMLIHLLLPGAYVAITQVNAPMLRSNLALSIAGYREGIPYSALTEIVLLILIIELIVEGSVRLPRVIGPTITMIGGIIIGQGAVQAKLVSPMLTVVTAVSAIASFQVTDYTMGMGMRVAKYFILAAGATLGLLGIMVVSVFMLSYLADLESFGMPYLAPVAPIRPALFQNLLVRLPVWQIGHSARPKPKRGEHP